jgi:hypothetical protein
MDELRQFHEQWAQSFGTDQVIGFDGGVANVRTRATA